MAFDLMRFLGGVNAYNTGQPIRGPSGSRGLLDLFEGPRQRIDRWAINQGTVPTPEERAQFEEGLDRLASELPPTPNRGGADGFGNPEIVVQNRPPAGASMVEQDVAPPALGNRDWLLEAQAAKEAAPDRKGMFGMKGTLRDVVGILGDAFLVQGGGKAIYGPQRQLERKSDAIVGMTAGMDRSDPATAAYLNAIERAAYEDPAMAEEMLKGFETRQLNQAVKENQIAQRTEATKKTAYETLLKGRSQLQRILSNGKTPEQRARLLQLYGPKIANETGLSLDQLGASLSMNDEDLLAFANADMNVFQTQTLEDRDRQIGIAQQNADANTTRANRPVSTGRPAQVTEAAEIARIRNKVNRGEKLQPGDQQTWDTYQGKGKKGGRRTPPSLPPGFKFKQ